MQSFADLVYDCGVSVADLADWCGLSRQCVYRYMNGDFNPKNISYINISSMATYLQVDPDEVYNCLCESFESKRIYSETLGKWMLPEEIIEKVR